jgi:protein-disulfide isomerase
MFNHPSLRWSFGWVLLAATLTGANCRSNDKPTTPLADASAKPASTNEAPPNEGLTEAEAARLLPGIDTASLNPKQRDALVKLTQEIICPCAAETVAACIRKQPVCKAAVRATELGKKLIAAGAPEAQTIMYVEGYYGSFDESRRVALSGKGATKGPENAKVVLEEFSDFQCPSCRAAHPVLAELAKKYPNDLKIVFRNFPLPQHEQAYKAATYGVYANSKGKFWLLADYFFAHQDSLGEEAFKAGAKEVGLNWDEMKKAVEQDPKYSAIVDQDKAAGTEAKISGTPSMFINGRAFMLPKTLEYLSWTVEDELEWIANGKKWASK